MVRNVILYLLSVIISIFGIYYPLSSFALDVQGTVTLLAVCGVNAVTGSPIVYGSTGPYIQSSDQTLSLLNPGNAAAAITVRGTDWNGVPSPSGVMLVGATHYSMTSGQAYGSKSTLTSSDASLTSLNPLQTKSSFWQLETDLVSAHADFVGASLQTVTISAGC